MVFKLRFASLMRGLAVFLPAKGKGRLATIAFTCFSLLLVGCHTIHPRHRTSVDAIQTIVQKSIDDDQALTQPRVVKPKKLPQAVNAALLPPLSRYLIPARSQVPRFDVTASNIPAQEFFIGLVAGTTYNMVVHPDITGNISLKLKNVTIRQAMDAVRDIYGYEYRRTSYGYEIQPPQLETQLFHLNYLDIKRTGHSYTQLTTGQVSNKVGTVAVGGTSSFTPSAPVLGSGSQPEGLGTISSIETKSEIEFWKTIGSAIENLVGKEGGRSVTVNKEAGIIAVHAYPRELHRVATYVNSLQSSLNRQVILEAKILEVQLDDGYQAGIDWSILGNPAKAAIEHSGNTEGGIGQQATSAFPDTELKELNGIFAIRVNGNFKALVQLLQTQGNVQVLSSPHIATINNQKAVIKVGQDEFFVTGVSTSNTIIGTNTLPSQDVALTPFFSGVTLDVTPEISRDNDVVLHIHPSISKVTEQTKVIGLGTSTTGSPNNLTLPLARSTIRESDNIVRAKSGQVIVIGGLMQNLMDEQLVSTPWISKLPFVGAAFRRTKQRSIKSELVILLRPVVATNKAQIESLEDKKRTFQIMRRPFHSGGLPKVFGNEGERAENE